MSLNSALGTATTGEVQVNGATVNYTDISGPAGNTRNPIVLVHGTGGTTAIHFHFIAPMASTRARVIGVDLADTNESELTLEGQAAQVEAVINKLVPGQKITLLGYSLGAVVAELVAARNPETVENLILLAGWMKTDEQQKLRNKIWHDLADGSIELLAEYNMFCAYGSSYLSARTEQEIEALKMPVAPTAFRRRQMDLNRRVDIVKEVESIKSRTLIIGFTEDNMVPLRHSREMFGAIADARLATVQSGHAGVNERPAQIFSLIDIFTADPERYPAGSTMSAPLP